MLTMTRRVQTVTAKDSDGLRATVRRKAWQNSSKINKRTQRWKTALFVFPANSSAVRLLIAHQQAFDETIRGKTSKLSVGVSAFLYNRFYAKRLKKDLTTRILYFRSQVRISVP